MMLQNYFKIACRNLWRHKTFSLINVLGLAVGMTACFLIFLYVRFELSYDTFHNKADRIYRVSSELKTASGTNSWFFTSAPIPVNIKSDFPEVESFVRLSYNSFLITKDDVKFQEEHTLFADSSLFSIFNFQLLEGNPRTALKEPLSIVLSKTAAKKYFGKTDPLGQIVQMTSDKLPAKVTGIMNDITENSQIKADMFVSLTTISKSWNTEMDNQWRDFSYVSYLLLKPGASPSHLQAMLPGFLEKHYGKEMKANQLFYTLFLEPLRSIYLHSKYGGYVSGNINYVYIFSIIALFVLLIASINFINLATARATERAKEVGIRKLIGAARGQLVKQFMGESVLLCLVAFLLSIILSASLLPLFNQLAGKTISDGIFTNSNNILTLLLLAIGIGVLAGVYPALILSAYKPALVLKGRFASGNKGILLRKGLVILQFSISIILIIATTVVYTQLHYMRNRDLGFTRDQTMVVTTNGDSNSPDFKQQINLLPHILSTTFSNGIPGSDYDLSLTGIENKLGEMHPAVLGLYRVDYDYIGQYNLELVAGRAFSKDFGTDDKRAMILNQTAARSFGYTSPQQAIGKRFVQGRDSGNIIGVVRDFHFYSLQERIAPLTMRASDKTQSYISIKVGTTDLTNTIDAIKKKWEKIIPNRPFNYFFLDDFFDMQYRSEARFGRLFVNFALLAIFISCLGLLGLSSFSTLQRTREIGIRKVLGGTISGIVYLISKDFLKLIIIAFLIASPVAWWIMNKWLLDFAYRINISWWIIVTAGFISFLVALLTVGFQSIRAANANPVKSLRSE